MSSIPTLTDKQIRQRVGERSFDKGRDYAIDSIFDARRTGTTLKAKCHGSQGGPYRVLVRFEGQKIAEADCSCPVGDGGCCKHVAALLITWRKQPDAFQESLDLEDVLAKRSREELIALVRQMVRAQPDLESLLDAPLPVPGKQAPPAAPKIYQKQASGVFNRGGDEWDAAAGIAVGLFGIVEIGDRFVEVDDRANALSVYEGVAREIIERYEDYDDENGDLINVLIECAEKSASIFKNLIDPLLRERVLKFLFDVYVFDTDAGGIGASDGFMDTLITDSTPDERGRLTEWTRAEAAGADGWPSECYGGLLLDLEADTLDDEAFLRICRDTGRREDLVDRLLKLKRLEEAEQELRKTKKAYEMARMADLFVSHKQGAIAEQVVRERLKSPGKPDANWEDLRLLEWLKARAAKRRDAKEELALAEQIFHRSPSFDAYALVKACAQKTGSWEELRPALLQAMQQRKVHDVLIRIHLAERELDEAIAVMRMPNRGIWGRSMDLDVARAAEKARPQVSLEIYRRQAETLIKTGGRHNYKEACRYLKKVRELHQASEDPDAWDVYVAEIHLKNVRLSALRDEMKEAGLVARPATPPRGPRAGA